MHVWALSESGVSEDEKGLLKSTGDKQIMIPDALLLTLDFTAPLEVEVGSR